MKKIEIKDFLDYRVISTMALSPNKENIAYYFTATNENKRGYNNNLCVTNISTKKETVLTSTGGQRLAPVWLSDKMLLVAANSEETQAKIATGEEWTEFYYISLNGDKIFAFNIPYKVTKVQKLDDRNFAFIINYNNYTSGVSLLQGEEKISKLEEIKENKDYDIYEEIPFWENGPGKCNRIRNRLAIYNKETKEIKFVSEPLEQVDTLNICDDTIFYTSNIYDNKKSATTGIWCCDFVGKKKQLLDQNLYSIQYVTKLKDKIIFFGSDMKLFGVNENPTIFELKGEECVPLFKYDYSAKCSIGSDVKLSGGVCYKTCGDSVYFLSTINNYSLVCKFTLEDMVTQVAGDNFKGTVDEFAILDSGILLLGFRSELLPEITLYKASTETPIVSYNKELFDDVFVSKSERVKFKSDNIDFEGFVLKPYDYSPDKTYPAILIIHGGPKATYGGIFSHEMQMWASAGYFVMLTNPRGSDGRGNQFADVVGKQGSIDYDDLMTFVDTVLETYPAIDKERLGVTGGSYGGYMTNWIIGHNNRFKAAVAQCSIANWVSKVMTTDIGYYFNMTQLAATPWTNPEKMWDLSPMKYADKAKTPTLFIHGEEDYRCWLSEPIQMFMSLKYHGVDSKVVVIHGEHHGVARGKPNHRIRRMEEIIAWFNNYLM